MVLILGVDAGFVTTAPTASGYDFPATFSDSAFSTQDTSPAGILTVTEIGWWCNDATEEANFEVGIYTHNVGDDEPEAVVGSLSRTNAKGTSGGWIRATGLNIGISELTKYWIAVQIDDTDPNTYTSRNNNTSWRRAAKTSSVTTLPDPWGTSSYVTVGVYGIYALVEVVEPTGVTRKIKIAGTFVDKPIKIKIAGTFVDKPIKIKVGGTFQDA